MIRNQRKSLSRICLVALLAAAATGALGSDQQKAEKRVRQISAMAVDSRTRAIVNQTMADEFHAKRIELMRQRHAMNMSYGSLFIAHELTATGVPMLDIALELEGGKDMIHIANERNANWKAIGDAAKKLNDKIDDNIYRHFLHGKADEPAIDKYDAHTDIVRADLEVTPEELASARADYEVWKNRGSGPKVGRLDRQSENDANDTAEIYKGPTRPHASP